ncbi:MAG: SWIM zinc finger family protein [Acidimicrobiales bacterium]
MAGDYYGYWPPPSKPRKVEGGLKARSRRGKIGEKWWSQRFIAVLESFNMGARLERGRRYARSGQVLALEVTPGLVTATVQGSRVKPYRVLVAVEKLGPAEWERVEAAMAARAVFLAKLLAGEMPAEIEEAFAACSLSVFPRSRRDLDTACSCPDSANPCKHVAATYYLLAEAFDTDPFLILAWRGRTREQLLDGLRARRSAAGAGAAGLGAAGAGAAGLSNGGGVINGDDALWSRIEADTLASAGDPVSDAALETFWVAGPQGGPPLSRRVPAVPAAILRQLDPTVLEARGKGLAELLGPAYPLMTAAAARTLDQAGI